MTTYYICNSGPDGTFVKSGFVPVEGEAVHIPGFEEFGLFVHQALGWHGRPIPGLWHVSEVTSGAVLGNGYLPERAIAAATENLIHWGREGFRECRGRMLTIGGISPMCARVDQGEEWSQADRETLELATL